MEEKKAEEDAGKKDASMMKCVISKCQSPFLTLAISDLVATSMGIEEESMLSFKAKFTTLTTFNNLMLGFVACKYENKLPTAAQDDKKLPQDEKRLPESSK